MEPVFEIVLWTSISVANYTSSETTPPHKKKTLLSRNLKEIKPDSVLDKDKGSVKVNDW